MGTYNGKRKIIAGSYGEHRDKVSKNSQRAPCTLCDFRNYRSGK